MAIFICASLAAAQDSAPKFDVVAIHRVPPNTPPTLRDVFFDAVRPGGQFLDERTTVQSLIGFAYGIKHWFVLSGVPKWAKEDSYFIAAKQSPDDPVLPPAQNRERVRLMMRDLLLSRFHLKIHSEIRPGPIYFLDVAPGGLRLKAVAPPEPPARETPVGLALGDDGGRMIGKQSTVAGIVNSITVFLREPVVDRTGLHDYYDFDIKWSAPQTPDSPPARSSLSEDGIALLVSTVQKNFGLKLSKGTGPIEYWVVDSIEQPTGN